MVTKAQVSGTWGFCRWPNLILGSMATQQASKLHRKTLYGLISRRSTSYGRARGARQIHE
jgi:hypothetical protein